MVGTLGNRKGQTSIEWLLLLLMAFITAYVMIQGPVASFTKDLLTNVMSGIQNLITNAEWTGDELQTGTGKHPSAPGRLKPMHL